jgi:hypothetical protein
MIKRIASFKVVQSSKTIALLYTLLGLVLAPFLIVASLLTGDGSGVVAGLFAPILYGVLGFVGSAIGFFCYNLVATRVGGIEVVLTDTAPARPAAPAASTPPDPDGLSRS